LEAWRSRQGEGQGFGHRWWPARHGHDAAPSYDLNLTDAQKTQIHSIMESNKPTRRRWKRCAHFGEANARRHVTVPTSSHA
jgi:Spy/CpxP family protein refolding chaperone